MLLECIRAVRTAFITAAFSGLTVYFIPALRSTVLDYGPRSSRTNTSQPVQRTKGTRSMIHILSDIKVPHSWFASFYGVSVALSLLWILLLTVFRRAVAQFVTTSDLELASTPYSRTQVACILMLFQGIRRLLECLLLTSSSASTMWIGHWFLGILFYVGMSVAIWIEGLPAVLSHEYSIRDIEITAPNLRTFLGIMMFTFASGIQHDCHAYLASLKTSGKAKAEQSNYQLPTHPAFSLTLTPHYLMECIIYLSLAILTAPAQHWLNGTVACALVFVITNLGITAIGTRKWYAQQFGLDAVVGKAAMVPFLF